MVAVRKTLSTWPIEYHYTDNGIFIQMSGRYIPFDPPSDIDVDLEAKAVAVAFQKFAGKAQEKITTFQGGVAAGEFNEAVRQLASPTKRLRSEVMNLLEEMIRLKRRVVKNPRLLEQHVVKSSGKALSSIRNAIADTWLEWSFGVKPMINDCQDAYLAFQKMAKGRRVESVRIKAGSRERSQVVLQRDYQFPLAGFDAGFVKGTVIEEYECEVLFRGAYAWRSPDGNFPLPQLFGVDLSNIAPTAWELIPWSFFVDYFTDVGSAIEAASIRLVEFGYVNYTVRNRTTRKWINLNTEWGQFVMTNYKPFVYCAHPYAAKGSCYKVSRFAGLPPMVPYKPQFKLPHSNNKLFNIAALLNGILQLKS
jgi:hypothetical protein